LVKDLGRGLKDRVYEIFEDSYGLADD